MLDQITTIVTAENYNREDAKLVDGRANWFEIRTDKSELLICAENEEEMREWMEAIESLRMENNNEGGVIIP